MYTYLTSLRQLPEEEQKTICDSFLSLEKTVKQLSNEYDVPYETMKAFLKLNDIQVGKYLRSKNDEMLEAATHDYMNGMLMKDVSAKYKICGDTVFNYMNKHGINFKNGHGRKNFFNQHFFEHIDREDKAYFLGFLYADGWIGGVQKGVYERPCNIVLDLSSTDRNILEKFLECIEASGSTKIRDHVASERTYKASPMSLVSLTSTKMADDLISHGFCNLKPDRVSVPELPDNMYRHFVRGYFDGDGCATTNTAQFTGQYSFLSSIDATICRCLQIEQGHLHTPYDNLSVADLQYHIQASRQSIFNWFYESSSIYLERKKRHFQDTLK